MVSKSGGNKPVPFRQNQFGATLTGPIFKNRTFFSVGYDPVPTLSGDPTNNFAQIRPATNNSNSFQVRIDHHFSERDTIFFRYTQQNVTVFNPIGNEGSTEGSGKGRNYGGAALRENPNWSVTPSLTWLKGNHSIKLGGWYIEAKRVQLNTFQTYVFNDEQTRLPTAATGTSGLSLASALLGFPNNLNAQLPVLHGGGIPSGSFGNFGRNVFRGKSVFNTDLSLFKSGTLRQTRT